MRGLIPRLFPVRTSDRRRSRSGSDLAFAAVFALLSLACLAVFYVPGPLPPAPASVLAIVRWLGLLFGLIFAWVFLQSLLLLFALSMGAAGRALALLAVVAAAVGLWAWLG